jgi:hypothetical protein
MIRRIQSELSVALGPSRIPGSTVAVALAVIYDLGEKFQGRCTTRDLADAFQESLQVTLSDAELDAIFVMYPAPLVDDRAEILIYELSNIFRPSLSPRRLELVELAFNVCDEKKLYILTEEDIRAHFNGEAFKRYIGSDAIVSGAEAADRFIQSIQLYLVSEKYGMDLGDFCDYYSCVSAEILDDNDFEKLLRAQWFAGGN